MNSQNKEGTTNEDEYYMEVNLNQQKSPATSWYFKMPLHLNLRLER